MAWEIHEVTVATRGGVQLNATLTLPEAARGVVLFAHGSGSSRTSPRNRRVAERLVRLGLATLLLDLLTADEEKVDRVIGQLRFDIELLAGRLLGATLSVGDHASLGGLPVGLFGASTGAAAALLAAARLPDRIQAVVSRGGRPDLAGGELAEVHVPTLLIVGGDDPLVLDLNRLALRALAGPRRLEVIPGATHLFEEPGALERVADLAGEWFLRHLVGRPLTARQQPQA